MRLVVLDQDDVGKAFGGAGEQLGLQLLADVVLRVAVIDDDVHVGMGGVVARRGLAHGRAVEIGVPAPDGDVDRQSGARAQPQSPGQRKRGKAQVFAHRSPPFPIAPLLGAP